MAGTGGGITTGGVGGWGGGGLTQADSSKARTAAVVAVTLRRDENMGIDMWLLIAEAGVALFLLVFIVWWTMAPSKKAHDDQPPAKDEQP